MKKITLILTLMSCALSFAQTKKETYDYLNQKLEQYRYNDPKSNYIFLFQEVKIDGDEYINLVEICTLFKRCSTAYLFEPKNYSSIVIKEKEDTIWFEIYCKYNSIQTQEISLNTNQRYKGKNTSTITIILDKSTTKKETNRMIKAFKHLLKLYGVEKVDLFDD